MTDTAYIALGSNVGEREEHLAAARRALAELAGVVVIAESEIEETEPLGGLPQGNFLNQMIAIRTELNPHALLSHLQRIERDGGRVRDERWGPRTIDLDIVGMDGVMCNDPDLALPHPELCNRGFWRRELAELAELQRPVA